MTIPNSRNDALAALNASLMSGGSRNAFPKNAQRGDQVSGTIVDVEQRHRAERDTGRPLYWLNNRPQAEQVTSRPVYDSKITLQTTEQVDEADEGLRSVWVDQGVKAALKDAVERAESGGLEIGGRVEGLMYVGDDDKRRRVFNCERYVGAEQTATASDSLISRMQANHGTAYRQASA